MVKSFLRARRRKKILRGSIGREGHVVGKRERLLFRRETFSGREKRWGTAAVRDSAMLWTRKSYVKREIGYYASRLVSSRLVSRLRSKEREGEGRRGEERRYV